MKCKWEHPNGREPCKIEPEWVITVAFNGTYAHSGYCALHIDDAKEYAYHGAPVYDIEQWKEIWPGSVLMK